MFMHDHVQMTLCQAEVVATLQLGLKQRYTYFTCLHVFKCLHGLAPKKLMESFKYVVETTTSSVNTRNVTNAMLHVPRPFCEMYKRSFEYQGPTMWNTLPMQIRSTSNIEQFKCLLKLYILSSM